MEPITFHKVIKAKRVKIGLTAPQLAEMIMRVDGNQMTRRDIYDIENGSRIPPSDHLVNEFAKALDICPDYLQYLKGKFPPQDRGKLSLVEFTKAMARFRVSEEVFFEVSGMGEIF